MAKLLVPLVMLGAVAAAGGGSLGPGGVRRRCRRPIPPLPPPLPVPGGRPQPHAAVRPHGAAGRAAQPGPRRRGAAPGRQLHRRRGPRRLRQHEQPGAPDAVPQRAAPPGPRRLRRPARPARPAPGRQPAAGAERRAAARAGQPAPPHPGQQPAGRHRARRLRRLRRHRGGPGPVAQQPAGAALGRRGRHGQPGHAHPWTTTCWSASRRARVARLPRLARLDLTANRLRALPPVPGPPGPSLAAGGNPLHCNCELLWLRRLAQPGRLESCATPAPLAGRLLWAVPEEELTCRAPAIAGAAAVPAAVLEGQPLRLGCLAAGDPPPALHWLGPDGRVVQNGSRRAVGADGSSVELRVATLGDHGHFTCVASNAAGEAAARVRVDVLPLPVPPNGDNGDAGDANGPSDMARGDGDGGGGGGTGRGAPGPRWRPR
ncbi:hypothetical protein Q9966_016680 [Columba livia]|nr:hypothetical protein Q9966_016680 [Columba livia]